MSQKKRKILTLTEKSEIIRKCEGGMKKSEVAKQYEIPPSSLSTILKNKEQTLKELSKSKGAGTRKKIRSALYPDVEDALFNWFVGARAQNVPISGPILQAKARDLGIEMGYENFDPGTGWLQRFKNRHAIICKTVAGEAAAADVDAANDWLSKADSIMKDYAPADIYNADETGLFYQMLPLRTLTFSGERCEGGKNSKQRLTVLFCANMDGSDKRKPLLIGKSAKPRCFKGINVAALPIVYRHNKKAWMTQTIFREWLVAFDHEMAAKHRRVLLLLDNCTAHNVQPALSAVKLEFFPPNTTSKIQPMDQGVIASFKCQYRKRIVQRLLVNIEKKSEQKIDILMALELIRSSWNNVAASTIQNCFHKDKAGFHKTNCQDDDDEPISDDDSDDLDRLWSEIVSKDLSDGSTFADFCRADDNLVVSPLLSDAEIVSQVLGKKNSSDSDGSDDDDNHSDVQPATSAAEALECLDRVKGFLMSKNLYSNNGAPNKIDALEHLVLSCHREKKQCSLDEWVIKK